MPTPKKDETRDEWMGRCVPYVMDEGKEQSQAVAQCAGMWESKDMDKVMERAFARIDVKRVEPELRRIEGIATTPTTDRVGDIIESEGVQFKNPMPFLWQHNHDQPVGWAKFGKATKSGIPFEAQLADPAKVESTTLKERLMEAWDSVKLGLVKGVSIGFIPLEFNFMKDGGLRIEKSDVIELSLVTIPANTEATILQIKSAYLRAASGIPQVVTTNTTLAPEQVKTVPASRGKPVTAKESKMPRTIAEQLSAYEAKRAANVARMQAIAAESDEKGSTMEEPASEEFATLDGEIKAIDEQLVKLKRLDELNKQSLVPAAPTPTPEVTPQGYTPPGSFRKPVVASVKANVPPGTAFIRLAMALAAGKGDLYRSIRYAKESIAHGGWDNTPEVLTVLDQDDLPGLMQKAAIAPGTTYDPAWAAPLVVYTQMASEYVEILRPATIIGRIPGLRRVPFNIQIPVGTQGTTVGWVGEQAPKPVSQMTFTSITFRWAKAAGIVVITTELARFSNPAAEAIVRGDMIAQMAQFLDRQFVDPSVAAVTNVSPASITNGVAPVTPTGTNQAAFVTDAKTLINQFLANNLSTADAVWIGTQQQAVAFSLMLNALGQPFYPTMNGAGGTLLGYPYIGSENIPATGGSPADGYPLILCKASEILLADDGQTVIDASDQASLQMSDASTLDSPPTSTTNLVSLWQLNLTGIRAERWINWAKRRSTAVGYIQNAKYG